MRFDSKLVGKNITLRQLELSDCRKYYADWLNNPDTNKYIEPRLIHQTTESVREYVDNIIKSLDTYIFAIICEGKHIGNIQIGPIHKFYNFANIGYVIGEKEFWGKGIATEAIGLTVEFSFNVLKLHRLQALVFDENIGSKKALIKNGFEQEATYKKQRFIRVGGEYLDYTEFGLLREEWQKSKT